MSTSQLPVDHVHTLSVQDATDAFVELTSGGMIRDWNSHAVSLFGWSVREANGHQLDSLILAPACRSAWQRCLRQCLASRSQRALKKRLALTALHKDGQEIPVEFTITLVRLHEHVHFAILIRDMSQQRHLEDQLKERTALLNLCTEAAIVTDMEGRIQFWSAGAEQMYGFLSEYAIGRKRQELLPTIPATAFGDILHEMVIKGSWEGELTQSRSDGTKLTSLCRWIAERDTHGNPVRVLMTSTDISASKQALQASTRLRESEQRFKALFENHSDGVFAFSPLLRLTATNQALCEMTGYGSEELQSMSVTSLIAPECLPEIRSCFIEAMRGKPQARDLVCMKKDGERFDVSIIMLPNIIEANVVGVHGIVKDISHRKESERRIEYLANHDALTGLPNRNLLEERMKHAIEQAKRLDTRIGVLFMDLNRFKIVNDSLGHEVGDLLLRTVAQRLKVAVREGDTVARLGGDEFVVLLENIHEFEQIARIADTLLKAVQQPVELVGHVLTVSTSIGASVFPLDGQDAVSLFKNADLAMYAAKATGHGQFRLYDEAMNATAIDRLHRENSLRNALHLDQFVLHYQPRLDIATNAIVGVEALVRWNHPATGMIYPANFIPLAEEIGVIDALGEWVLLTACHQLKSWQNEKLPPIRMSVNLSTLQLGSARIQDVIRRVLDETELDSRYLELEITESSLMQDIDAGSRALNAIKQLGVSLSIDDFGTGYSSLGYLKRLPIDTLKIDKSFVGDITRDSDDAAIVSATIAMAHSMDLRVVAEGVTSHEQMRFLEEYHCDEIQGYLLCQPLPPDEAAMFFRTSDLRGLSGAHVT